MKAETFSTSDLPAPRQFDAWMGWFDGVFDASPHDLLRDGFAAQSESWHVGGCMLSRVQAPAIRVHRNLAHVRRNPLHHWVITLGRHTTSLIGTGDTTLRVPPGIPFVLSLADEMTSERAADQRLQLYLSREKFADLAPALDQARGTALDSPLGSLFGDYLVLLERILPDAAPDDLPRLSDAIGAMVAACLAREQGRAGSAGPQIDLVRLERIRHIVRRYLRSPALGPRLLCRRLSMSRSKLYRLMDAEGGVARYIQRQRLLEAYALLSDPSTDRPITAIAEELCFPDTSGFSRAFRRAFGVSPSDIRLELRDASGRRASPAQADGTTKSSLRKLLSGL
ncbi:MAG TPA: helix-turn-helix domain-containing protein [Acetobacteraceae bacterium]|nr:helix-turn-helix domain-containing protein [Acetobacteraceae bacterium]